MNVSGTGVIYMAIGDQFLAEARVSAASVRRAMPHLPIVLFTDQSTPCDSCFDEVQLLGERAPTAHLDKLIALRSSPFERTLFLDTDTYVCADVSELFDLLARFDLAMTHDRAYYDFWPEGTAVPEAFREFNQGVIVARRSDSVIKSLDEALRWAQLLLTQYRSTTDQISWRPALYASELRIATLTHEYNCRFHSFGQLNGEVRILHGRIPGQIFDAAHLDKVAARINRHTVPRVFAGGRVIALMEAPLGIKPGYPRRSATLFPARRLVATRVLRRAIHVLRTKGVSALKGRKRGPLLTPSASRPRYAQALVLHPGEDAPRESLRTGKGTP